MPEAFTFDPQYAAALRLNAEMQELMGPPAEGIAGMREHAARARRWWNEGGPKMAAELELKIPVGRRELDAVAYVPVRSAQPLPAYVHLHGGGWRIGEPRSSDRMLREIAASWGGIVLSLDYVHMPEHVFPAAVEDTAAAYQWLAGNGAQFGIDGMRLGFGGTSAGANVATGAAIQAGGSGTGFLQAGAMLVGLFDHDLGTGSMQRYDVPGVLPTRDGAAAAFAQYLPQAALREDPRANCVAADLGGMPPLFLAAAEVDIYRDSSRRFAAALQAQGARCELQEYPGMGHFFTGYSRLVDGARRCGADVAGFLRRTLPADA